ERREARARSVVEATGTPRARARHRLALGAVQQLAPGPVAVTARLRAAEQRAVRRDERVLRALASRQMIVAPLHVEGLQPAVGTRLTAGAVRPRDRVLLRRDVRHDPGLEISRRR